MKKVVIAIIILMLAAFVSYTDFTGNIVLSQIKGTVPYAETQIKIDPVEAKAGETIKVTITPGSDGAKKLMEIFSENGARKDSTSEWCNLGWTRLQQIQGAESYKCIQTKTFNYRIPASFKPGDYYIRIYDYAKNKAQQCAQYHGQNYYKCAYTIVWFTVIA